MANRQVTDTSWIDIVGERRRRFGTDLYLFLLAGSWWRVIGTFVSVYLAVNLLFGAGYRLTGGIANARADSFRDAFFFSVQTIGTIGYGAMYPKGGPAQVLVLIESMVGIVLVAVVTGIVFAKFSRPRARIRFTSQVVITPVDGVPTLMFRCANDRGNHVVEASVSIVLIRHAPSPEGAVLWRSLDLAPVRARSPTFTRTWTVMHLIDASSPLYGATPESVAKDETELVVTVMGLDSTSSQMIHATCYYDAADLRFGVRHADMLAPLPDGRFRMDLTKFDELVPARGDKPQNASMR
jgi:inward rectifier potassium channel